MLTEDLINNELKTTINSNVMKIDTITELSESQLDYISKLFGQGEQNERHNDIGSLATPSLY